MLKNLANYQKPSKDYENTYLQKFFFLLMPLLTAIFVKISNILASIYFIFLKKVLKQG